MTSRNHVENSRFLKAMGTSCAGERILHGKESKGAFNRDALGSNFKVGARVLLTGLGLMRDLFSGRGGGEPG